MDDNAPSKYKKSAKRKKYVRRDRKPSEYYKALADRGIVKRGPRKHRPNIVEKQEPCNKVNDLVEIWKNSNRGSLEMFEYKQKNGNGVWITQHDTKPVYAYNPPELRSNLSFWCANCVDHTVCEGYFWEAVGSGVDGFDISLVQRQPGKRKCECSCHIIDEKIEQVLKVPLPNMDIRLERDAMSIYPMPIAMEMF